MSETETCNFGEHLTIDGYRGNQEKLNDKERVFKILDELPIKLGMNKLAPPVLYEAESNNKKDPGGWTGMVIIAESHISIHTFPKRRFLTADIYTCKNGMDLQFIINYFKEAFDLEDVEDHFIKRGTKYPVKDIE